MGKLSPPEVSLVEVEVLGVGTAILLGVGTAVGPVGPVCVTVASSCPQNAFTIDVADAALVGRLLHPEALTATEEAAETAAGN